jgi:hypothetical protein
LPPRDNIKLRTVEIGSWAALRKELASSKKPIHAVITRKLLVQGKAATISTPGTIVSGLPGQRPVIDCNGLDGAIIIEG